MRNLIVILIFALAWPLATWACEPEGAEEPMTMTGIVRPLGPSFFMQGSHQLVDDEGELVALLSGRGSGMDLDAWVGKRVRVQGRLEPTVEGNRTILYVTAVEPMP